MINAKYNIKIRKRSIVNIAIVRVLYNNKYIIFLFIYLSYLIYLRDIGC